MKIALKMTSRGVKWIVMLSLFTGLMSNGNVWAQSDSTARQPILSFQCKNKAGETVKIEDFKGKVVYLDVWATWCMPCRMQFPKMKVLKEEYKDKEVVFLYVSVDTDYGKWTKFLDRKQPSGVHLIADDFFQQDFSDHYGIYAIPRFMLIDKKGMLFSADANRPGWDEIREDFNLLLAE